MTDSNNSLARFLDAAEEPNRILLPIEGYEKEQIISLELAVEPIKLFLHDLDRKVKIALQNSQNPSDNLSSNESAAICLYTMEWQSPHKSLYTVLNEKLRSECQNDLKPWFRYLKLFLTALYKLPSIKCTIWRGMRSNVDNQYDENSEQPWWGFSSCTESMDVTKNFLGSAPECTLFIIECIRGKSIAAHSYYKTEKEILLMPGTYLYTEKKWNHPDGSQMIHLQEIGPPYQLIAPPFDISSAFHVTSGQNKLQSQIQSDKILKSSLHLICPVDGCFGTLDDESVNTIAILFSLPVGVAYSTMYCTGILPISSHQFTLGFIAGCGLLVGLPI
ncbi:unnamed protein product [Adineta ricciae]|uniref:NAD(P)(+)--arginine ADP-ribosyltransferase n=1 Tax=Adineta ricciae TaxID=249248 RepID=A0A815N1D2_ADIRI|nr:unnamed protein product [Adineta ricciae]CAF1672187.1 unnamed protein product [Adineta ricciae]